MKKALILHNPNAGDENHVKASLIAMLEANGYTALYHKVKKIKGWQKKIDQVDFAVLAGGDGTIRRAAKELLKRSLMDKNIPLAILPMGTANNLSRALGIDSRKENNEIIKTWNTENRKPFDVGIVKLNKEPQFFLEGAGFGLFPLLIASMESKHTPSLKTAQEELTYALEMLHALALEAPAHPYQIKSKGEVHKGKFIGLEVLNTPYVGPNLHLAPNANIDDSMLDIVYIDESQRLAFATYIKHLIDGKTGSFMWKSFRAKQLSVKTKSTLFHIDDELLELKKSTVSFEIRDNVLRFIR